MIAAKSKISSVEEYIASFPKETREALETIRGIIKSVTPDAVENISYQIAAFRVNGRNYVSIAGWKKHVSIYPMPSGSEAFNRAIARYADGKSTIKLPLDQPLPLKLIERAVKYRLADHLKNTGYR